VGRTPNGKKLAAEKAGVAVTDRGFINVDIQMRTNVPHTFAIGGIVGQPMLARKAPGRKSAFGLALKQSGARKLPCSRQLVGPIPTPDLFYAIEFPIREEG
jgi:pyruvate/2-oxoglutarate dehydrogenase complex dihydrolipoamide dehydrogenase (E3) component